MFYTFNAADMIMKTLPHVTMTITQSLAGGHPLVDGIAMRLTCRAYNNSIYSLDKFIDMRWSGLGLQRKSLWITESKISKHRGYATKHLYFRPCLEYHAGEYTCHLTVRDKDNSTFVISKIMKLKSKYHNGIVHY